MVGYLNQVWIQSSKWYAVVWNVDNPVLVASVESGVKRIAYRKESTSQNRTEMITRVEIYWGWILKNHVKTN
jgi:hypothetical protein